MKHCMKYEAERSRFPLNLSEVILSAVIFWISSDEMKL